MANDPDDVVPKVPAVPPARIPFEVRLLDYLGAPMANRDCSLKWGRETIAGATDGDGVVKFKVPSVAATGIFQGTLGVDVFAGQPKLQMEVVMENQLAAPDTARGLRMRLSNLGFLALTSLTSNPPNDAEKRALERFRFAHKLIDPKTLLPVGADAPPFDAATVDRLQKVHDTRAPYPPP